MYFPAIILMIFSFWGYFSRNFVDYDYEHDYDYEKIVGGGFSTGFLEISRVRVRSRVRIRPYGLI